ncbi:MAG TPA: ATP-binding cassette domain-containing protein [Anaerolineales bacterium]|nr:ATP-binding cassette domain-containing protein [Anaerolineales bacterium]
MTAFLRFHDLTKSYFEGDVRRVVLQNAHAEFQPGEVTAILGRSGSGKSTLLNLISGIDEPDDGEIWVDGRDLTALPERDRTLFRRARIGFIFQFYNLIPTLTVGENVSLPLELNRLPRPQVQENHGACSQPSGCSTAGIPSLINFPAANSSASRSPARWCMIPC